MAILKLLHLLAAVLWVGGMFFAYTALRPAAVETLQPPERLRLWEAVFRRFLKVVWWAITALVVSGTAMIGSYDSPHDVPLFVGAMILLGCTMIAVLTMVYFFGYLKLRSFVRAEQWQEAGRVLANIRQWVAINLTLGVLTLCVVSLGRSGHV